MSFRARPWRREKADVNGYLQRAREGEPVKDDDGQVVGTVSPTVFRAAATRAHRLHEARLIAGHEEDEQSVEAEAGALLEAETAHEIHGLFLMVRSYIEATNKGGG